MFSREAVLHGLRNIQKGNKKIEEKREVILTRSIAVLEREDTPLSLSLSLISGCFVGCILESVVHHLFSQHSVDKSTKPKQDDHTVMYWTVKVVNRAMELVWSAACGEELDAEDFHFMDAMRIVLDAFSPGGDVENNRCELVMFFLEIYVELWVKFGIEHDLAPHMYVHMEDHLPDTDLEKQERAFKNHNWTPDPRRTQGVVS